MLCGSVVDVVCNMCGCCVSRVNVVRKLCESGVNVI